MHSITTEKLFQSVVIFLTIILFKILIVDSQLDKHRTSARAFTFPPFDFVKVLVYLQRLFFKKKIDVVNN